ncbi:MAG: tetratricopeptide repeat protein [Anaerolineaceae bacterium]|nr:tetratricopeptide repeat protein [Anaerolineaceae bacterium]
MEPEQRKSIKELIDSPAPPPEKAPKRRPMGGAQSPAIVVEKRSRTTWLLLVVVFAVSTFTILRIINNASEVSTQLAAIEEAHAAEETDSKFAITSGEEANERVSVIIDQIKGGTGNTAREVNQVLQDRLTSAGITFTLIDDRLYYTDYGKIQGMMQDIGASVYITGNNDWSSDDNLMLTFIFAERDAETVDASGIANTEIASTETEYMSISESEADIAAEYLVAYLYYGDFAYGQSFQPFDNLISLVEALPPDRQKTIVDIQDLYFHRGYIYQERDDYADAIADYTQAMTYGDDAWTYNNRGNAYLESGDLQLALADFTYALELDPEYIFAYNNRGIVYFHLDDYERALQDYDQAIQLDPDYPNPYWGRGDTNYELENYQAAIEDYRRYAELSGQLQTHMSWRINLHSQ